MVRAESVEYFLPFGGAKRIAWAMLTPVVWLLNRAGLCGYQWVNLCAGARRRDLYDPLWHHLHFGDPVNDLPEEVILCGISYDTQYSEGLVTFRERFSGRRITFTRDEDARHPWVVELGAQRTPATHVVAASEWVYAVFGGTFNHRRSTTGALP